MLTRRTKIFILVALLVVVALLLFTVRRVLTPFLLAAVIAYLGHPFVQSLEAKEVPRAWAIVLMYAIFAVFTLLLVFAILPSLARELEQIALLLPEQSRRLEGVFHNYVDTLERIRIPDALRELINATLRRLEGVVTLIARRTADFLVGLFGQLFNLVLAPFLAFYILRDTDRLGEAALAWLPGEWRKNLYELLGRIDRVVGSFIRGQLIVSAIIGLMASIGLSLLGVKYALFLGMLTGIADIIPYFGPVVSAVPALALALIQSPTTAIWVLILLVLVQQLEGSVLSPKIVGDQVDLHPLSVIFVVLVGGELFGILGMLVAVPAAATIKTISGYFGDKIIE